MATNEIITMAISVVLTVMGYFTKATMTRLEKVEEVAASTKIKLEILQNDHQNKNDHLEQKIEALTLMVKELSNDIKELNKRLR
ncbi:hypothetical protein OX284_004935 [Flavobacterium sp. SUN046]|uniref:hypothetical protein n=1 Tax=Flavobacterium sp. SUN046 TaxID=3002440 RepID=UPI002DB7DD83|nr:hypothetical protein [Flavobacterium sp. SUN046]MEC4048766.1 hypothetical protein [Flavobacterium sp. SUN046]